MSKQHKILLLDDDQDVLDLYKEMLSSLPSSPEVHVASTGARAIALLESQPFTLLLSDLKMPKMDGLQLLSIVRKRWPSLRTIVMSGLSDEHFKDRAYAMGIDQFLEKPRSQQEITFFCDCIEGLLNTQDAGGSFRGVQSKSLMDIIQLECLSQSSVVLKIMAGPVEGRIWIENGDVIDAVAADAKGEEAFKVITSWRGGSFEILPPEPGRNRTIQQTYHSLLLETAQAMDEAQQTADDPGQNGTTQSANIPSPAATAAQLDNADSRLYDASRMPGVEFLVAINADKKGTAAAWGLQNPDRLADWLHHTTSAFRQIADTCQWGELKSLEGKGINANVAIITHKDTAIGAGWERSMAWSQVRDGMKKILARWIS